MIVEGDAHHLMVLSTILTELGIRFKRNTTGIDVLSKAQAMHDSLDFILLSIDLHTADAFTILKTIKADPRLAHIPVIAMSEEGSFAVLPDVQRAGFAAFVPKPIPRRQFGTLLTRVLAGEDVWEAAAL